MVDLKCTKKINNVNKGEKKYSLIFFLPCKRSWAITIANIIVCNTQLQ